MAEYRTMMHAFARAIGLNRREMVKAGARIGLTPATTHKIGAEIRDVSQAERLAMTAALFDLPAFDERMVMVDDRCRLAFDLAKAELARCMAKAAD